MGNSLSNPEREALASAAATVTMATTADPQASALRGGLTSVLQSSPSHTHAGAGAAVGARGKKFQCRWCIETFERKFNKDRHEDRKHAEELAAVNAARAAAAAAATETHLLGVAGRKRTSAEALFSNDDSAPTGEEFASSGGDESEDYAAAESLASANAAAEGQSPFKRARSGAAEATGAHEHVERASSSSASIASGGNSASLGETAAMEEELDEVHEALQSGILFPEGTRQELAAADERISASCTPFLSWLCAPAVTESERIVKARRVDPKQLAPIKKNLAFIIKWLLSTKLVEAHQLKLDVFTQEHVCQQLNTFLEQRQVGASRVYALLLLIKKMLVFLASSESARRREYIAPNTWNSWTVVDTICSDSNTRRKQISRNRKLLGAEQSKKLERAPGRSVPTADDLKMPALYGEKKKSKQTTSTSYVVDAVAGATSQPCADPNELRPAELKQITRGCLEYLGKEARGDASFVAHLVTATLCLGMAPRQQVLRQLQLGSSFVKKDDGRYWILMLSHMNKNGRATTFPIAQELTQAYDFYLSEVRPQLMGSKQHNYLFCTRTGDAPGVSFDFSAWTRSVAQRIINRPANCHAFRSALVTTFYKTGATQSEMNALADVMAHDPATARDYYFKEDARKQAMEAHERMRDAYGLGKVADSEPESQHMADAAVNGAMPLGAAAAEHASPSFTPQSPPLAASSQLFAPLVDVDKQEPAQLELTTQA